MTRVTLGVVGVLVVAAAAGCRGQVGDEPPILLERNMYDQERYNPQSYSNFFPDHRTMRAPVEGTVPRERYEENGEIATGRLDDDSGYVLAIPPAAIQRFGGLDKMLERGQARFTIYCVPCHDASGSGKGTVAVFQPGFPPLPSFNDARLRSMPDGQVFLTITNGVRNMPSYAAQIPTMDRWAIVSYVRALQLSQVSKMEPKK